MSKHQELISKGWTHVGIEVDKRCPYGCEDTDSGCNQYTHPKDYHTKVAGKLIPYTRCTLTATSRQRHMDHCKTLKTVKALFGWPKGGYNVREVYIVNDNPNLILGNTDGYDDWGHILVYNPGSHQGADYDYLDTGRY